MAFSWNVYVNDDERSQNHTAPENKNITFLLTGLPAAHLKEVFI